MSETKHSNAKTTQTDLPAVVPPPFNWKDTPYGKAGAPLELPEGAELHACLGLNSCKGQDRYGIHGPNGNNPNSCAGQGFCATTEIHSCHTNNNCANQGGCGLYGWGPDMDQPGQNDCRSMGSCAAPINAERFITEGDHKGMSVWTRARQVFEEAYAQKQSGEKLGAAPAPFSDTGPTESWITENCNSFAACGASGLSGGRQLFVTPPPTEIAKLPRLGLGLGLRNTHFDHILTTWPEVDWFEAISENFMDSGGRPRQVIRKVAERYPVVLHGVSLSIGSSDPLNMDYLQRLKHLAQEVQPQWISDHLCWTGVMGLNSHDLLPVPLTEATLDHIAARVHRVQEVLGRPLILENPSTYLNFRENTLSEPEFLRALCDRTDCGLLLDVNNVFVSCFNAESDPVDYFDSFPWARVVQMHLAGHTDCGSHLIDTHDQPVRPEVWALFALAWQRSNGASTLLEWDGNIPAFEVCHGELLKAKAYMNGGFASLTGAPAPLAETRAVSNPVSFLVPDVMAGAVELEKG